MYREKERPYDLRTATEKPPRVPIMFQVPTFDSTAGLPSRFEGLGMCGKFQGSCCLS